MKSLFVSLSILIVLSSLKLLSITEKVSMICFQNTQLELVLNTELAKKTSKLIHLYASVLNFKQGNHLVL